MFRQCSFYIPFTAQNLLNYCLATEAYDIENLAELLQHETFMEDLSQRIPRTVITEDFLRKAWEGQSLRAMYDGDLEEWLLNEIEDYYTENFPSSVSPEKA
jgi:hypothetical protein